MDDELERCRAEIRHLKETITAMRGELEKQHASYEDRLDKERSALREERKHLQGTIAALRADLEAARKNG